MTLFDEEDVAGDYSKCNGHGNGNGNGDGDGNGECNGNGNGNGNGDCNKERRPLDDDYNNDDYGIDGNYGNDDEERRMRTASVLTYCRQHISPFQLQILTFVLF